MSLGGKQARIIRYLAKQFPDGVPEPSLRPRNLLRDEVLRGDPTLRRWELNLRPAMVSETGGRLRAFPINTNGDVKWTDTTMNS
jgi:hypothetical protein